ncbi:MAG TPA: penicillin-binding transpeptidase domain-containing protein [Acetobacteraceae bacterium]|nr:penicillin-binding transpeptidase domain-containing protein [Acetobacteraceae bacterium]
MSDVPPADSAPHATPAQRVGASRTDTVPRIEMVRITQPDLQRRGALEKTRGRLVYTAFCFGLLFLAVICKLADATILQPLAPHRPEKQIEALFAPSKPAETTSLAQRAMITDRNGQILAISLPTVAVFADPRQIIDPAEAAHRLKQVLPRLDEDAARVRLADTNRQFVYLERQITPREQLAINTLGIPGIDFRPTEQRHFPMGRTAAQVLGGTDVDEHGVAGVEKHFDQRLFADSAPLRLSLDVRVQAVVRDELYKAIDEFQAIGGCGIVMDVTTGEVLAMVSLPDYDANDFRNAPADDRFNRAVTGMYEPGSTFKLQTASMALDSGIVHIWDEFDASRPIHIGRFTITDFEGKHRWLYLPEVLAYSSNLGAAHIADTVGGERQRAWLKSMGMFARVGIELPEAGLPIIQPASAWKQIVTLTVAFGHGISVSPLHVVRGTAAVATGVLTRPTILALPTGERPDGMPVMQPSTSETMRKLMRLVVTDGFGKQAEVPGYYPGGKTGTAEKVGKHGYVRGFKENFNVAAFTSVFPMNAPRYAVYMMVDEPHGNKSTYGYSTAGWVAAPAAGRVIARIAPMLGMLPDIQDAPAINQALYIPLEPGRPAGAGRGPLTANAPSARPAPVIPLAPARPMTRDPRHEAAVPAPSVVGAAVLPATVTSHSLAAR